MNKTNLQLQRTQKSFAKWRSTKSGRTARIPNRLWQQARVLCGVLPSKEVAHALGLDKRSLGLRCGPAKKIKSRAIEHKANKPRFVAVDLNECVGGTRPDVLRCEWVRTDGAKLCMELGGGNFKEVVSLFLGGGL